MSLLIVHVTVKCSAIGYLLSYQWGDGNSDPRRSYLSEQGTDGLCRDLSTSRSLGLPLSHFGPGGCGEVERQTLSSIRFFRPLLREASMSPD